MYKFLSLLSVAVMLMISCGQSAENADKHAHPHDTSAATKADPYKDVDFAVAKDLVCGMPLSAGVNDTCHYEGKVYGFCAKECKEEFLKDPAGYLSAAK